MPVPTDFDRHLDDIENIAASVRTKLTIFRHAGNTKRDFESLRSILQDYVNAVMKLARSTEP